MNSRVTTKFGFPVFLYVVISLVSFNGGPTAKATHSGWTYGKGVTPTMQNEKSEISSSRLKKPFGLLADKIERILLDLLESNPSVTRNLIDEDIEIPLPTVFGYGTGSVKGKISKVEISELKVKQVPKLGATKGYLTVEGKIERLRLTGDWFFNSRISNLNGKFDIHALDVDYRLVGKIIKPGKDARIDRLMNAAKTGSGLKDNWAHEKITGLMDSLKSNGPSKDDKIDELINHLSDNSKRDQDIASLIAKLRNEEAEDDKTDAESQAKPPAPVAKPSNKLRANFNVTECGINANGGLLVALSGTKIGNYRTGKIHTNFVCMRIRTSPHPQFFRFH